MKKGTDCRYDCLPLVWDTNIDTEFGQINIRRREANVNDHNSDITTLNGGNSDIRLLFTGFGVLAMVHYMTKYMIKYTTKYMTKTGLASDLSYGLIQHVEEVKVQHSGRRFRVQGTKIHRGRSQQSWSSDGDTGCRPWLVRTLDQRRGLSPSLSRPWLVRTLHQRRGLSPSHSRKTSTTWI